MVIRFKSLILTMALSVTFHPIAVHAQKLTTLYDFQGGMDGAASYAPVLAVDGNLYGSTREGGTTGNGTIYEFDLSTGAEKVLYSFLGGNDGMAPNAIIQQGRFIYGTTLSGGSNRSGTAFKVNMQTGAETVLHTFSGTPDGSQPEAGLVLVGGNLYGTTAAGGTNGDGTIFEINPTTGAEQVIHSFVNAQDGSAPESTMTKVGGILYGTTGGGPAGFGTIFKYDVGQETVSNFYSFSSYAATGSGPNQLVYDKGFLFGTTAEGGSVGAGTVFKIEVSTAIQTILYNFSGGSDGGFPFAGVVVHAGEIYGTTDAGGLPGCGGYGCGTAFAVDANSGAETVLYSFDVYPNGSQPAAPLINLGHALYGTTSSGGESQGYGPGTIFKLVP